MSDAARHSDDAGPSCLLIYDAECRLCVATKTKLEPSVSSQPLAVTFVPYQSDEAKQALGSRYRSGRPDMAYLVDPSGSVREGLEAFLPLLSGFPGGGMLLKLAHIPGVKPVLASLYRMVARHRYRWFGSVTPGS